MNRHNTLRNPWVTGTAGILLGAALVTGANRALSGDHAPNTTEYKASSADQLDQMLRVGSLVGPVATKWESCPVIPGAVKLSAEMQVGSWVVPKDVPVPQDVKPEDEKRTPFWKIKDVTRYTEGGRIIAWCGAYVPNASNREPYIQEPAEGTIVLVPNTSEDPGCAQPQPGQAMTNDCSAFEYNTGPQKGTQHLQPLPSTDSVNA